MSGAVVASGVAAALGLVGGLAVVLRVSTSGRSGSASSGAGVLRLEAVVHTGVEQTMIGLARDLDLPRRTADLAYGALFSESEQDDQLLVRSRSEIGRGFLGVVELQLRSSTTVVRYSVRRLPSDDSIYPAVLDLDARLVRALRRLDGNVVVRISSGALRDLERVLPH